MKGNKKALFVVALLVLVGLTSGYVAHSYAKYASQVAGQGTATVAKWDFDTDNASQTISMAVTNTVVASSLVNGKIAPGTQGNFTLNLTNSGTETGVAFTIDFALSNNAPSNLKLYSDSTFTTEIVPGTDTITGKMAAGYTGNLSVPIYWKWAFGTSDDPADTDNSQDTADGELAETMTIDVTITGVQTDPTVAVTTGLD